MKKLLFISCFILSTTLALAQGNSYREVKAYLRREGYTISNDLYADLRQGNTSYYHKTFYAGLSYIIVALSDDRDVRDVDVCLYESNGDKYECDTDTEVAAAITFSPSFQRTMRVEIINYRSNTPNYASRCRYIIAYK